MSIISLIYTEITLKKNPPKKASYFFTKSHFHDFLK